MDKYIVMRESRFVWGQPLQWLVNTRKVAGEDSLVYQWVPVLAYLAKLENKVTDEGSYATYFILVIFFSWNIISSSVCSDHCRQNEEFFTSTHCSLISGCIPVWIIKKRFLLVSNGSYYTWCENLYLGILSFLCVMNSFGSLMKLLRMIP